MHLKINSLFAAYNTFLPCFSHDTKPTSRQLLRNIETSGCSISLFFLIALRMRVTFIGSSCSNRMPITSLPLSESV